MKNWLSSETFRDLAEGLILPSKHKITKSVNKIINKELDRITNELENFLAELAKEITNNK